MSKLNIFNFDYNPYLTILGLIFFSYVFLAGWGTDPKKYDNINDTTMDCKAILHEVDRVGIVRYIGNGEADAPQHYYKQKQTDNEQLEKEMNYYDYAHNQAKR